MSSFIQKQYINRISYTLDQFKWEKDNLANCRCPICGDSQKSKYKARFYFYEFKGNYSVKCHNCGYGSGFVNFLKDYNKELAKEYRLEAIQLKGDFKNSYRTRSNESTDTGHKVLSLCKPLKELTPNHPAIQFVAGRKIPPSKAAGLFYVEDVNTILKVLDKKQLDKPSPRVVIPFINQMGHAFAAQMRAIDPSDKKRYISLRWDYQTNPYYGQDTVDPNKPVLITEGPFDSMFLSNSVAMAGSGVSAKIYLNQIFVFDNEPRNKEIISLMRKRSGEGNKVTVWGDCPFYGKDINEMVLNGANPEHIQEYIMEHSYDPLRFPVMLHQWKKIA